MTPRAKWLATQECSLCGHKHDLRLYRHMGTRVVGWTPNGPSHRDFRIVCGDGLECRKRQIGPIRVKKTKHPPYRTRHEKIKLRALRGSMEKR